MAKRTIKKRKTEKKKEKSDKIKISKSLRKNKN